MRRAAPMARPFPTLQRSATDEPDYDGRRAGDRGSVGGPRVDLRRPKRTGSAPIRGTPPEELGVAVTYRPSYGVAADLAAEHRFEEAMGYVADDQVDDVLVVGGEPRCRTDILRDRA